MKSTEPSTQPHPIIRMNNQPPNPRFDPFSNMHGQFPNAQGINSQRPGAKLDSMMGNKQNQKMEMEMNREFLQDKNLNGPGADFLMNAAFNNPGFSGFDPNYLNYFPNNFGNGGQNPQAGFAGGNPTDGSNLYLSTNNSNPNNFLLQNNLGLGNLGADPASMGLYEGFMKNPNELWMQGGGQPFFGDKAYLNGANLGELDNQFLLGGLDDFSLNKDLNGVGNGLGMLGGSNKMLQGLSMSGQLGGLGNMQNPMLLNNFYGIGDQNLNMLLPNIGNIEDLYQLQMQNSNPTQLHPSQMGGGQMNPGLNKQLTLNSMPDLKIENNMPSLSGNFNNRALNDSQNLLGDNFTRMGSLGGPNYNQSLNPGMSYANHQSLAKAGANQSNFPNAGAGGQAGMSQYLNNLNKAYPGSDLENANFQKYLPYLLNSGNNSFPQPGNSNPRQSDPTANQSLTLATTNSQRNYNNAGPTGGNNPNADLMADAPPETDYGKLLSMNYMKQNSNPVPQNQMSQNPDLDAMNRGLNSDSWLNGMRKDQLLYGPGENYNKWRERQKYERTLKIEKYKNKKRIWSKKISYDCRKRVADTRLRIKGRFISKKDSEKIGKNDGKQEETGSDRGGQNVDYITAHFGLRNQGGENGIDSIAMRSNMQKKDLIKKIDDLINNSNGAIDTNNILNVQLPPHAKAVDVLEALSRSANSQKIEEKLADKIAKKKKIFKILHKKIRKVGPAAQSRSVQKIDPKKDTTPLKHSESNFEKKLVSAPAANEVDKAELEKIHIGQMLHQSQIKIDNQLFHKRTDQFKIESYPGTDKEPAKTKVTEKQQSLLLTNKANGSQSKGKKASKSEDEVSDDERDSEEDIEDEMEEEEEDEEEEDSGMENEGQAPNRGAEAQLFAQNQQNSMSQPNPFAQAGANFPPVQDQALIEQFQQQQLMQLHAMYLQQVQEQLRLQEQQQQEPPGQQQQQQQQEQLPQQLQQPQQQEQQERLQEEHEQNEAQMEEEQGQLEPESQEEEEEHHQEEKEQQGHLEEEELVQEEHEEPVQKEQEQPIELVMKENQVNVSELPESDLPQEPEISQALEIQEEKRGRRECRKMKDKRRWKSHLSSGKSKKTQTKVHKNVLG